MIDLPRLRTFCAVARHQSYTRAADELFISQPHAYAHVRDLERALGVKLIEQVGKTSHLTESGRILYEYGVRILGLLESAEIALREAKHHERGYLFAGAGPFCSEALIAELVRIYRGIYPGVSVRLVEGDREIIEQMLLHRELDVAIYAGRSEVPDLAQRLWYQDNLVMISPGSHPLASHQAITPEVLHGASLAITGRNSEVRASVDSWLADHAVDVDVVLECSTYHSVLEAVARGIGISFLPELLVTPAAAAGRVCVVNTAPPLVPIPYYIAHVKGRSLPLSAIGLLELLERWEGKMEDPVVRLSERGEGGT